MTDENVPALQRLQEVEPDTDQEPTPQEAQLRDEVEPIVTDHFPASQFMQNACELAATDDDHDPAAH